MEKITLIHGRTPLYKMNFKIGKTNIYVKRDDIIEFALGGNKVRLFEYLAAEIRKSAAEKVITFGSIHSNHLRVTSFVAAYLGISADLIVLTNNENIRATPNIELANLYSNVTIVPCKKQDAHDFIEGYLDKQNKMGTAYYWIPGGGHTSIAPLGYIDAGKEIIQQLNSLDTKIDAAFVPCGTGTTQTGLICSINEFPVYGITVARTIDKCINEITALLEKMTLCGYADSVDSEQIHVISSDKKYGIIDEDIKRIINGILKSDGFLLDPIYNAKSFLKMIDFIKQNRGIENVLYINTGGTPNIFTGGLRIE